MTSLTPWEKTEQKQKLMDNESDELCSHSLCNESRINRKKILAVCWHRCILNVLLHSFSDYTLWKSHEASPVTSCRSKDTSFRAAASHLECLCWSPFCCAWEFERSGSNWVQKLDNFSPTIYLDTFWILLSLFISSYLEMFCNNVRMVLLRENTVHVVQKSSAFQGSRHQLSELMAFKISGNDFLLDRGTYFICLLKNLWMLSSQKSLQTIWRHHTVEKIQS